MIIETTYALYLAISVALTVWVARTLSKNGRVFLVNSFASDERLADSINHLLVLGAMHFFNVFVIAKWGKRAADAIRA
jgi:hypothetical protein